MGRGIYFREGNILISFLPEAYRLFVNKGNKTTEIPAAFSQGCPLLSLFFFKRQRARSGGLGSGLLSPAPGDLLKVSRAGFEEPPDGSGGT